MPKTDHPAAQRRQREIRVFGTMLLPTYMVEGGTKIVEWTARARKDMWLKRCRLLTGKYAGRECSIEGVIPDAEEGFLYLCYVQRADGRGALNTDGESRAYRPAREFELL